MLHVVLFQPEIPPNTGNIIRLCANTGFALHLIKPLGFELDDKRLRRAGLDYHEFAELKVYDSLAEFIEVIKPGTIYACTTRGKRLYSEVAYQPGDALLFGPETRGLPQEMLDEMKPEQLLRLPMQPESRSLNLSNAAAVFVYEAWRQLRFEGAN
ncbi:MAG: tRNA (uridine(34)/cytosine(34)/5-carboxymethylaminomethyluridine(34)-2'-O)-methyltransferase TrmL [Chromatiales bacterium]|nr:tRNA (uridine(34)/cytosine(34)/5-carboxymethylaminomethyluridine(34)-2'-O)-methyltransferase TrmL [Chromatiales bacterium]